MSGRLDTLVQHTAVTRRAFTLEPSLRERHWEPVCGAQYNWPEDLACLVANGEEAAMDGKWKQPPLQRVT